MAKRVGFGTRARQWYNEQIVQRVTTAVGRIGGSPEDLAGRSSSDMETRDSGPGASSYDWYIEEMRMDSSRFGKYKDYEKMDDEFVEAISALDVYADNATEGDSEEDEVVKIKTDNPTVKEILDEVKERLRLDAETWAIARELAKYGDKFEEVVVFDDLEVHRLKHLPPETMKVKMDKYGRLDPETPYVQVGPSGEEIAQFKDWQIIHFKLRKSRGDKYGVDGAVLYPVRKLYRQIQMMEDAIVINRLTRAQQRYAYLIDVTGIEPGDETHEYIGKVRDSMSKRRTIDPRTGKMDLEYNPLSSEEDIFLASREGKGDVKSLPGQGMSDLGDVEHFRNKFFAGIKLPKAWLGFEEGTRARAVLTEQDVQAARTVRRIQMAIMDGYRKLFNLSLMVRGIDPSQVEYTISMPAISTIDEMREWEIKQLKSQIAQLWKNEMGVSTHWLLVNMLGLSEEEIEEIQKYLGDPKSLDNVTFDREMDKMRAVGGDGEDDEDDVDDEEDEQEEQMTKKQMRIARRKLRDDIRTLKELLDWEIESKGGNGLSLEEDVV